MSEPHNFTVLSSDGVSTYEVVIYLSDSNVRVRCSCPAGMKGKLCKHKVRLLNNDEAVLADKLQGEQLSVALSRMQDGSVFTALRHYRETESDYRAALVLFERAKMRLEKALKGSLE